MAFVRREFNAFMDGLWRPTLSLARAEVVYWRKLQIVGYHVNRERPVPYTHLGLEERAFYESLSWVCERPKASPSCGNFAPPPQTSG